VTYNFNLMY